MWIGGGFKGPKAAIQINVQNDTSGPPPGTWRADYFNDTNFANGGGAYYQSYEPGMYLFHNWGIQSPGGGVRVDYWSARFTKTISFPGGQYHFQATHDDSLRVYIDGQQIIRGDESGEHGWDGTVTAGNHEVKAELVEQTGDAHLYLFWQGPGFLPYNATCIPSQWCGQYWGDNNTSGQPALVQDEGAGVLSYNWVESGPGYQMPTDNWSARYTRNVYFPCGSYHFLVGGDDGIRFWVDGVLQLDKWPDPTGAAFPVDLNLTEGNHTLRVDYFESGGVANMQATWQQTSVCPAPTNTSTNTPTPANGPVELLTNGSMHLVGNNGDAQVYQEIPSNILVGKDILRLTYDLHGLQALGLDASAIIFDQANSWHYISLSSYGVNGKDGQQTVDIPLSAFPGLDLSQPVGTFHTRFWYSGPFTVDIISAMMLKSSGGTGPTATSTPTKTPSPTSAPTATPTNTPVSAGTTTTLRTVEDTYVDASQASTVLGSQTTVSVDGSPVKVAYLKLDLSSLIGVSVTRAKLRLYITNESVNTQDVHDMTTSWNENTMTWNNRPTLNSAVLATINSGAVINTWVEVDITSSVQAHLGSLYALGIDSLGEDGLGFNSRENSSNPLELVITYTGTPAPTRTPTPTNTPTPTQASGSNGSPYGGTAWAVPGTIQAEDFNTGGLGVAYSDDDLSNNGGAYRTSEGVDISTTSDASGSYHIGWTREGEWLKYTVSVKTSGSYIFNARVASANSGATFHAEIDGVGVTGPITVPNTGGWGNWTTVSKSGVTLSAGQHVLRIVYDTRSTQEVWIGDFNYFSFTANGTTNTPTTTPTAALTATPTSTATQLPTATSTAVSTQLPTATSTPAVNGTELLSQPMHLVGNNGAAEAYQSINSNALAGKTKLRVTYNLHGLSALGGDASALIFDQNGWQYVSLSNYGTNGLDGSQTVEIPLSGFSGLNPNASVGMLHTRFWYNGPFTVDITSVVVL
jgi:hypothetical protein